jgi:hypothetical protein
MAHSIEWIRAESLKYASRALPLKRKKKKKLRKIGKKKRGISKWKAKYLEYLNSPHWQNYRLVVINERGKQCEECGRLGPVAVHHVCYERLGRELDIDVQVLCNGCHAVKHGKIRPF